MYTKAHAAIRADPTQKAKAEKTVEKKRWNRARISAAQRIVFYIVINISYLSPHDDKLCSDLLFEYDTSCVIKRLMTDFIPLS